ncbi:uncharacterized protein LOC127254663 [Andrographis paniculata]|uniref:uncharacterized protein LOC127254663 n=1 Tax=Andrographis paniculata TaxID=175694 RepID=UPI0021E7943F|nr:uncharacterized protein LOC127254663 [Andrographis paniculata]
MPTSTSTPLLHYLLLTTLLSISTLPGPEARTQTRNPIRTEVFRSPQIDVEPGQVSNKFYVNIDFPNGHIAIKSFDAELVDGDGRSVPLYEAYLHHWIVLRYHQEVKNQSNIDIVDISGVCDGGLSQYFGLGSETRRTPTDVPDPYGIEVGNPDDVPAGFREGWLLNVHAIDTRGARDKVGCLECACDLYGNISDAAAVPGNYSGGLLCCVDGARCRVKEGVPYGKRSVYLKYTVKYLEWDDEWIKPVRIYILDVTDLWTKGDEDKGIKDKHDCQIEYDVLACPKDMEDRNKCMDSRSFKFAFPKGGDVIYGVGHQHIGGTSIALYGEGGREICISHPIYGTGDEAGNERGYVVGMSTCYPTPGSLKIGSGEMVTLVSNYSSAVRHTGVMSLFYLLIADN